MIPPRLRVRKVGDPARADRSLIPEFAPLHDPKWKGLPTYLHYDANYLLIVDNLSDFAHLAFGSISTMRRACGITFGSTFFASPWLRD